MIEEVLANVAQDVGELQRDAEVVGQLVLLLRLPRLSGAVDAERQPPDAARHAAAVPEQVVERLVGGLVDVGEAAVDQLLERRERGREPLAGVGERDEHRVRVVKLGQVLRGGRVLGLGDERVHLAAGRLKLRGLLRHGQVAVTDVVDPPGECVHGGEGAALVLRQQPDAVGEVPGLLPGDLLALGVGVVGVHLHLPLT